MKRLELFHLPGCPYCIKAEKAIRELTEENPAYGEIDIHWIDESEQAEYADSRDYYYVPTIFFGEEKLYEAHPSQHSKEIKAAIRSALDRVLASGGADAEGTGRVREIQSRVSIRRFQDKPVEKEKIVAVLRAAMQAPSAGNQQPWEFYVVTDRAMLEALSGASRYAGPIKNAPVAVVAAYCTELWAPEYAHIDMSTAMENLWLEAGAQGLGGVWLGIAPEEDRMAFVEKAVGIPEGQRAFALFPIGYPAEERSPQDRFDEARIHWM